MLHLQEKCRHMCEARSWNLASIQVSWAGKISQRCVSMAPQIHINTLSKYSKLYSIKSDCFIEFIIHYIATRSAEVVVFALLRQSVVYKKNGGTLFILPLLHFARSVLTNKKKTQFPAQLKTVGKEAAKGNIVSFPASKCNNYLLALKLMGTKNTFMWSTESTTKLEKCTLHKGRDVR